MQDLIADQNALLELAATAITEHKTRGKAFAKAEHDYRVALSKFITEKREEGFPVTNLSDIARGTPHIAELRLEKDIAQSLYESCKEAIQFYKLRIRLNENQIEREWHSPRHKSF